MTQQRNFDGILIEFTKKVCKKFFFLVWIFLQPLSSWNWVLLAWCIANEQNYVIVEQR